MMSKVGSEHRAVHAAWRALVGHVEDPAAECPRGLEVEDDRQRHRVERPDHDVIGHGAAERHVLRWTVLVGGNEPGQRLRRHVGLEFVGQLGQLLRQADGLGRRRRGGDRQPDEATQDVGQVKRLGLAAAQPGMFWNDVGLGRASARREEYCRPSPATFRPAADTTPIGRRLEAGWTPRRARNMDR